jgi:hypothetical protein
LGPLFIGLALLITHVLTREDETSTSNARLNEEVVKIASDGQRPLPVTRRTECTPTVSRLLVRRHSAACSIKAVPLPQRASS